VLTSTQIFRCIKIGCLLGRGSVFLRYNFDDSVDSLLVFQYLNPQDTKNTGQIHKNKNYGMLLILLEILDKNIPFVCLYFYAIFLFFLRNVAAFPMIKIL